VRANLVDSKLGSDHPGKQGYFFFYTPMKYEGGRATRFAIVAQPMNVGVTGVRAFYSDETGVIRYAVGEIPTPRSPEWR
jgi:hypothetical protein